MKFKIKKPFTMDNRERHCFNVLRHALNNELYIWPKVQIKNFLVASSDAENPVIEYTDLFEKRVDFVLCDKTSFSPLLILRFLSETAHTDTQAHKENLQLKKLFKTAGLPLLDIAITELDGYKSSFAYETLRDRIMQAIAID